MAYLELKGINKSYNGRQVLSNINLAVDKHSFVSLLGPSGCGKTTLLRIIAGLEHADSGSVYLDGKDITQLPVQVRKIGIVFQNYALFPHLDVFNNIAYGLKIKKYDSKQVQSKVNEVLEKVELSPKAKQNVSLLSGGEQQRVALARAIVTEPRVILLDEPLSNLDYSLRQQARDELKRLQNTIGITSVYVTHDQSEALALSDRISVLYNGSMMQTGSPREIYHHPHNTFTADFVGHYNLLNKTESSGILGRTIADNTVLAVLPEHLILHKATRETNIIIKDILFIGILTEFILSCNDRVLKAIVLTSGAPDLKKGDQVSLSAPEEKIKIIPL